MTEKEFLEALVLALARLVETLRTTSRKRIVCAFLTASEDPRELASPTEEVKVLYRLSVRARERIGCRLCLQMTNSLLPKL